MGSRSMEAAVTVLLIFVVGMFGVTSAVLGFIAEAKKLTLDDIHLSGGECVYPANSAHALAVWALILLAVAQIVASVAGGCGGCCRPGGGASKSTRRVVGVVVSILSWVMAVIAAVFYWGGAELNAPGTRRAVFAGAYYDCRVTRGGVFVRAAVLSLVATSLAIKSCVLLRAPAAKDAPAMEGATADEPRPDGQHPSESVGVAVGLPQWPTQGYGQARV